MAFDHPFIKLLDILYFNLQKTIIYFIINKSYKTEALKENDIKTQ
jgi:hypothetical protein